METSNNNFYRAFITVLMAFAITGPLHSLRAQTLFQGNVSETLGIDSFTVHYSIEPFQEFNMYGFPQEKLVKVRNDRFRLVLEDAPGLFYIRFSFPRAAYRKTGTSLRTVADSPILVRGNAPIDVTIDEQGIHMEGESKAMFDLQMDLYSLNYQLSASRAEIMGGYNGADMEDLEVAAMDMLYGTKALYDQAQGKAMAIAGPGYGNLPDSVRNRLLLDYLGDLRLRQLFDLKFRLQDSRVGRFVADFYVDSLLSEPGGEIMGAYKGNSPLFSNYLAAKIKLDLQMASYRVGRNIVFGMPVYLDLASRRFTGRAYDQVAFALYINGAMRQEILPRTYQKLLSTIGSEAYRKYLEGQRAIREEASRSYQFSFPDETGRLISNSDLKGKVVLMDFWFTGCGGCKNLHLAMEEVKEAFRDEPDIAFVSMNVDKSREAWLQSVRSGEYTDPGDVKLWIGKGKGAGIIDHYRVSSYPTMVLVGKDDNLVMVNPPDPRNPSKKKELIYLLREALKKGE
ncbi:thioredoxin-like domain-containing protein [Sphingobacterium mizutaii]|uniref:thioredoxin-like domain-containing protein n=1 Tax=Sphingobacterium mizutaii TaxID=1010 RepID=UPI0016293988|nr:thioredoxin-like domain-containing protein [Sphingobacterium mizutaii]